MPLRSVPPNAGPSASACFLGTLFPPCLFPSFVSPSDDTSIISTSESPPPRSKVLTSNKSFAKIPSCPTVPSLSSSSTPLKNSRWYMVGILSAACIYPGLSEIQSCGRRMKGVGSTHTSILIVLISISFDTCNLKSLPEFLPSLIRLDRRLPFTS